jgi:hypothetical protein
MDIPQLLADFGDWAFDRHANALSWYIRPLFLIPLAWSARRRSGWGIAGTLVALATSIFRFPAPARPDPQILEFLDVEREWVTGTWDLQESGQALLAMSRVPPLLRLFSRFMAIGIRNEHVAFPAQAAPAGTVPVPGPARSPR